MRCAAQLSDEHVSLAIAMGGETAILGAWQDNSGRGAAYVFQLSSDGGQWSTVQKLVAADGAAHDQPGGVVALHDHRALVGAWGQDSHAVLAATASLLAVSP